MRKRKLPKTKPEYDQVIYLDKLSRIVPENGKRRGPCLHPLAHRLWKKKPWTERIFRFGPGEDSYWVKPYVKLYGENGNRLITLHTESRLQTSMVVKAVMHLKEQRKNEPVMVQEIFFLADKYKEQDYRGSYADKILLWNVER